jgi:hypothetical protein
LIGLKYFTFERSFLAPHLLPHSHILFSQEYVPTAYARHFSRAFLGAGTAVIPPPTPSYGPTVATGTKPLQDLDSSVMDLAKAVHRTKTITKWLSDMAVSRTNLQSSYK